MRILFVVHHRMAEGGGVANATTHLADALRALGHEVECFDHAHAFGRRDPALAWLRFPSRVARHLAASAARCDVVDATSGDAARWLAARTGRGPLVITRAHGLEHTADLALRRRGLPRGILRRVRYRLGNGGLRLRDVARSVALADGVVMLNAADAEFARGVLGADARRVACLPNGLPAELLGLPAPERDDSDPLRIAFLGSWIPRKGIGAVTATINGLAARGASFEALLLGTGAGRDAVLAGVSAAARAHCTVESAYAPASLRARLAGVHLLLHPSWSEGFSLALAEGMACGLAPLATPAGAAWDLVRDGESGVRIDEGAADCVDAIMALAADRARLHTLRHGAQRAVQHLAWPRIAAETVAFYERMRALA